MICRPLLIALLTIAPMLARGQDRPEHWADEALGRLQSHGLFVGYPDGLVRGGKALSRYELAVALHGACLRLLEREASLHGAIAKLDPSIQGTSATPDLSGALSDLRSIKTLASDIQDLQSLARAFEFELTTLGIQVGDVLVRLRQLEGRVRGMESRVNPIRLSGDLTSLVVASGSDGFPVLDRDGRMGGFTLGVPDLRPDGSLANPAGLTRTAHVFQEAVLRLDGDLPTGVQVQGVAATGNLVWPGFGDGYASSVGQEYWESGYSFFWDRLNLRVPLKGGGSVRAGRFGLAGSELSWRRPDTTSVLRSERWDSGEYRVDGAEISLPIGRGRVGAFVGVLSPNDRLQEVSSRAIFLRSNDLNRVYGLDVDTLQGRKSGLRLRVYRAFDVPDLQFPTGLARMDRMEVLDGEARASFGGVRVNGGYATQTWKRASGVQTDRDGASWYLRAGVERSGNRLSAEYRTVDSIYQAPGDWGRLGIERNPTNIDRVGILSSVRLNSRVALDASGYRYQVRDRSLPGTLDDPTDAASSASIAVKVAVNAKLKASVAFEQHRFDAPGEDPRYAWTTLGLSYDLGSTGEVSLGYDWCDVQNERALSLPAKRFRGGQLFAQVSVRF